MSKFDSFLYFHKTMKQRFYFTRLQLRTLQYIIGELECCYEYDGDGFEEEVEWFKELIQNKLDS